MSRSRYVLLTVRIWFLELKAAVQEFLYSRKRIKADTLALTLAYDRIEALTEKNEWLEADNGKLLKITADYAQIVTDQKTLINELRGPLH